MLESIHRINLIGLKDLLAVCDKQNGESNGCENHSRNSFRFRPGSIISNTKYACLAG